MDSALKEKVKGRATCQTSKVNVYYTAGNGQISYGIEYMLPFMGQIFLMIIDTCSRWLKVCITSSATTSTMIEN